MAYSSGTAVGTCMQSRCRHPLSCSDTKTLNSLLTQTTLNERSESASPITRESGYFSESSIPSMDRFIAVNTCRSEDKLEVDVPLRQEANVHTHFPYPPDSQVLETHASEEPAINLEFLFSQICEELGLCWRELGRFLLYKECTVENIAADYTKVSERAYQVLLAWKRTSGNCEHLIPKLFSALISIGKTSVAQRLLAYLPPTMAKAVSSRMAKQISERAKCSSLPNIALNISEQFQDLKVEMQLKSGEENKLVFVCHSSSTSKRYVLKQVSDSSETAGPTWAARKIIESSQLRRSKKNLRKTNEFVADLQLKQQTIIHLKSIIETLQDHLQSRRVSFCSSEVKCDECDKTKLKQELILKELDLLHHELVQMGKGNRRVSISGIPTERIYNLAERAYNVCEEHKKMHEERKTLRRRCSQELLDVEESGSSSEDDVTQDIEGPLQCTLKILLTFGRRRKLSQSMRQRKKKQSNKVQRNESDKSTSRFYIPSLRKSFIEAAENEFLLQTWTRFEEREKSQLKDLNKEADVNTRRKSKNLKSKTKQKAPSQSTSTLPVTIPEIPPSRYHTRSYTFPTSLAQHPYSKPDYSGPEDLDLDDIDELGSSFGSVRERERPRFTVGESAPDILTTQREETCYLRAKPYEYNQSSPNLVRDNFLQTRDWHDVYQERDSSVRRRHSDNRPPKLEDLEYAKRERYDSCNTKRDGTIRGAVSDSDLANSRLDTAELRHQENGARVRSPLGNIKWAQDIDLGDIISV